MILTTLSSLFESTCATVETVSGLAYAAVIDVIHCTTFALGVAAFHPVLLATTAFTIVGVKCYNDHFYSFQETEEIYEGQNLIPFCLTCSPDLEVDDPSLGVDFYKIAVIPICCRRCSYFSSFRGSKSVRFLISNQTFDVMTTYSTLRMNKPRDVHAPFANHMDMFVNRTFKAGFTQRHFGKLSELENVSSWFWIDDTKSYCYATPWYPVAKGDDEALPAFPGTVYSSLNKMRDIWNFVTDRGNYPTTTAVSCQWYRLCQLADTTRAQTAAFLYQSRHVRMFETEGETAQYVRPPRNHDGSNTTEQVVAASPIVNVCGPILGATTVHNVADKFTTATAAESRLNPQPLPGQNPNTPEGQLKRYVFNSKSDTAKKFMKMHKFLRDYITRSRVEMSLNELFGEVEFIDHKFSKFKRPDVMREIEELRTKFVAQIKKRQANGKAEGILKDEKAVRFVVDNSLMVLIIYFTAGHIFEDLVFGPRGLFADLSIKNKDRTSVLDAFVKEHSQPVFDSAKKEVPLCGVEIDQTSMENHERAPCDQKAPHYGHGAMDEVYKTLDKILNIITHKLDAEFSKLCTLKLTHDRQNGMMLQINLKQDGVTAKPFKITLKFDAMYLDSGWLLTSLVNFINELFATSSAMLANPEHLFAQDRRGEYRMNNKVCKQTNSRASELIKADEEMRAGSSNDNAIKIVNSRKAGADFSKGDFNFFFKSIPMYGSPNEPQESEKKSVNVYWKMKIEGDDGAGRASVQFSFPNNRALVVANLQDIGFCGKLDTMVTGRLEFIGAHITIKNGCCDVSKPWTPAIKRDLPKVGVHATGGSSVADSWARHYSLALNMGHRVPALREVHVASANFLLPLLGATDEVTIKDYTEVARALNIVGTFSVRELALKFEAGMRNTVDVSASDEAVLIANSLQVPFNITDVNKLRLLAEDISTSKGDPKVLMQDAGWHEQVYSHLPRQFR